MTNMVQELEVKCFKMSFLLGICVGKIEELVCDSLCEDDVRGSLKSLLDFVRVKIEELYYPDSCEKPATPLFVEDPALIARKKAEEFLNATRWRCPDCKSETCTGSICRAINCS